MFVRNVLCGLKKLCFEELYELEDALKDTFPDHHALGSVFGLCDDLHDECELVIPQEDYLENWDVLLSIPRSKSIFFGLWFRVRVPVMVTRLVRLRLGAGSGSG